MTRLVARLDAMKRVCGTPLMVEYSDDFKILAAWAQRKFKAATF